MQDKWVNVAPQIALEVLGEPKTKTDKEWRWGSKGSFVFNKEAGTFFDFENDEGGGVAWLLETKNVDKDILQKFDLGFAPNGNSIITSTRKDVAIATPNIVGAKPISRDKLLQLWSEAVVKLKYNDSFIVLRFPDNHPIKQKYAPFTKVGDSWFMRRPEGKLPIYSECNHPSKPILINEGEKACLGAGKLYDGDVACWHGGARSWEKSDWSPIFNRDVYIFPDNDDVGKEAAWELGKYLKKNGCSVRTALPPKDFADKDDLWDADESNYFDNSFALEQYIKGNQMLPPKSDIYFQRIDEVMAQVKEPDWLIEDMFERESVMSIFGAAKSGKSFVAIAMACAVAMGEEFYGSPSKQATTLYLCGEGQRGIGRRVKAYEQYFNKDLSKAPLLLSNRGSRITEEDEFNKLLDTCKEIEDEYGSIGFIIFDTFQRNFSGNENSSEDVGLFIQRLDKLVAEFGATCCFVHHTGHGANARARGSSVIQASLDYEFKVSRDDIIDEMWLDFEQTLNKDGMGMAKMQYKFHEVNLLGFDNLTSGVLIPEDKPIDIKESTVNEETIKALITVAEQQCPDDPVSVWLNAADLEGILKVKRKTAQGRLKQLKEKGLVHYKENYGYQAKKWDEGVF